MGVESDQEFVQLVGTESEFTNALAPSLQECTQLKVFTQNQALDFIGGLIKVARRSWGTKKSKVVC